MMQMNSLEYLKKELEKIAGNFPKVNIKYGYNDLIDSHIVELLPVTEYYNNNELEDAWIPLSINFIQEFQNEDIAFISSDSPLSLSNIIFEFNKDACSEQNVIAEIFSSFVENEFNYSFPTEIPNGISIELPEISSQSVYYENSNKCETLYADNYSYLIAA